MKRNKSESQKLYNFVIAKAFQQSVGSMFTYSELRKKYSGVCSTNDQREVDVVLLTGLSTHQDYPLIL